MGSGVVERSRAAREAAARRAAEERRHARLGRGRRALGQGGRERGRPRV